MSAEEPRHAIVATHEFQRSDTYLKYEAVGKVEILLTIILLLALINHLDSTLGSEPMGCPKHYQI
ncbi:hypothetical protein D3C86_1894030 [compost metagenome]